MRSLLDKLDIKTILGLKVFFFLVGLLAYIGLVDFGEEKSRAQDGDDSQEGGLSQVETRDELAENSGNRRGYLENLLDLPGIDRDEVKKQEIGRYMALIEKKEQQVVNRLNILQRREKHLKDLEKKVESSIDKLSEERQFLAQTLQKEKKIKEDRLASLLKTYEKMEPKKAAPVFEAMDQDLAIDIFNGLFAQDKAKQVQIIMENMNPEAAVRLSEYLGRVRSGKEYEVLQEMNQSLNAAFQDCKGMPAE